jgi:hypothetical protein
MTEYYVYENWTHDRARIHNGDCGYATMVEELRPGRHRETDNGMAPWNVMTLFGSLRGSGERTQRRVQTAPRNPDGLALVFDSTSREKETCEL